MKVSTFSLKDLYPVIKNVLDSGGEFKMISSGTSMKPMLRDRQDTIVLIKPAGKLKKYDIPFYRRDNGDFVLHRIIGFNDDGYVMCGDNQFFKETGITDKHVVALLKGFIRDGKYISCDSFSFKCYSVFWDKTRPIRYFYRRCKQKLKCVVRYFFEKK